MLASIHPLGERARNSRWGLTAASFAVGSAAAGAALGLGLGWLGAGIDAGLDPPGRLAVPLVVLAGFGGAALDLGLGGLRLPSLRSRQVNDQWLGRYRGWVYGAGFGAQLGLGVATFVTTSAVYATWLVALLSASPSAGLAIGLTFGAVRGSTIFAVAGVDDVASLRTAHGRLAGWAAPANHVAAAAQAGLATAVLIGAAL